MQFKDIPSDLLLILVDKYISPDDIEAFSLSCRGVYDVANSRLRKHKQLNESFRSILVDLRNFCSRGEQWNRLCQCWSDPWTARYPKHLRIIAPSHQEFMLERAIITGGIEDMVRESAPFNRFISPAEIGDWRESSNAAHDAMAALCLSFLPNLYTVRLDVSEKMAGLSYGRVITVLHRSLDPERTRDCHQHLAQLKSVKLHARYGATTLVEWVQPFLGLPSMRSIKSIDVESQEMREPPYTTTFEGSKVTRIVSDKCLILGEPFWIVLSRLEDLPQFTYTHHPHPYYCAPVLPGPHEELWAGQEPQRIVNTLVDHASHSLQTLHLSFLCGHCARPIESLKDFNCLKSITLSGSLLLRKDDSIVDLVELLPSTVEYLKVTQEVPYTNEERPKCQKQQCELLTALPRLRENFYDSLRYQTLGIARLDCENNLPKQWIEIIAKYTVHLGPGGALRSFKPEEYLEWMECGRDPNPAVQGVTCYR